MKNSKSIAQIAEASGLSIPTLRFYEQEGLIAPVPRNGAGKRIYGEAEVTRINTIRCLRAAGLTLPQMKRYFSTPGDEEEALRIRKEILLNTQKQLETQRNELNRCMSYLSHKIHHYDLMLTALAKGEAPPEYKAGEFNRLFDVN